MNDSGPTPPPTFPQIELKEVFKILEQAESIPWKPFREGVDIHHFYGDGLTGPSAALIRFRQEARVPLHYHQGWEHILVLAGSQRDQSGVIHAGTLRIHAPGTHHSVISDAGCIVLAIYEKPVRFLEEKSAGSAEAQPEISRA